MKTQTKKIYTRDEIGKARESLDAKRNEIFNMIYDSISESERRKEINLAINDLVVKTVEYYLEVSNVKGK